MPTRMESTMYLWTTPATTHLPVSPASEVLLCLLGLLCAAAAPVLWLPVVCRLRCVSALCAVCGIWAV